jgi:hypothetical protein
MKKSLVVLLLCALIGIGRNAGAVSPMPMEELKHGMTETVCIINIVHTPEHGKGIIGEESSATFVFNASVSKNDVLEKVKNFISQKLNEENISDFKIECTFKR